MSEETRRLVTAGGARYLAAPDDPIPDCVRASAIVRARVVDELTSLPVAGPITVAAHGSGLASRSARAAVSPRAVDGGIVGLVGVPVRALPALRTQSYEVGVVARAAGYVPVAAAKPLGPIGPFPSTFAPADLGDLAAHRLGVEIAGRAMVRTPTTLTPAVGATVRVSGIWRAMPTSISALPPAPPDLVAIDPPLYADRAGGGGATLRAVDLVPAVGTDKRLERPVAAGGTVVHLSDRLGLGVGDVLAIDDADPERAEYVPVAALDGATSPAQSSVVTLAFALARDHRRGAVARRADVVAPGAAQALSLDGAAGDETVLLVSVAGVGAGFAELAGGGPATSEYHRLTLYQATSDADGSWRLPPISRVAQLTLDAQHPPQAPLARTVAVEYPRRSQRVDLVFD